MTPKQKAIEALELRKPEGLVPTFELEFQLTQELLGRDYQGMPENATAKERDRILHENAELYFDVARTLDYSIIMDTASPDNDAIIKTAKYIHELAGDDYMIIVHGDATYSIPSGSNMVDTAIAFFEKPDEMKERADQMVDGAIERGKKLVDGGIDGFALCADYCFNDGPFLSPKMFREFVTPYLTRLIAAYREMGAYAIKHTDGNIMPILDQLVESNPHGIHSIDTQAEDMDFETVKNMVGDKVCLCGGVQCGLLQTGTDEEVRQNILDALRIGMPGGGYIFCTSNVAFKGLPLERYMMMLELRKEYGRYE